MVVVIQLCAQLERGCAVRSLSFQTALIASSPPSTAMWAFFPLFYCSILGGLFWNGASYLFSFRQSLHQNADFIYEEIGGFWIVSLSPFMRVCTKFKKANGIRMHFERNSSPLSSRLWLPAVLTPQRTTVNSSGWLFFFMVFISIFKTTYITESSFFSFDYYLLISLYRR